MKNTFNFTAATPILRENLRKERITVFRSDIGDSCIYAFIDNDADKKYVGIGYNYMKFINRESEIVTKSGKPVFDNNSLIKIKRYMKNIESRCRNEIFSSIEELLGLPKYNIKFSNPCKNSRLNKLFSICNIPVCNSHNPKSSRFTGIEVLIDKKSLYIVKTINGERYIPNRKVNSKEYEEIVKLIKKKVNKKFESIIVEPSDFKNCNNIKSIYNESLGNIY